ncbi:MAG TPA: hypothetical protein VMV14_03235 [Acidimicrobiales bacterium]|nr:hypothetical protein [Acidimicrobiales bacterium]
MRIRSPRTVTVLVALSLGAAACSSGAHSAATTTTTMALNPATAQASINTAYSTLFTFSDKSVGDKEAVIQGGTALKTALAQALASPLSSSSTGARVDTTLILYGLGCSSQQLPSPCAKVTYDILGASGAPSLAGQTGYAVYLGGKWLVAKATICGLLGLFYTASGKTGSPPGC